MCELYCGQVPDVEKFDEALIGHYIGIDVGTSGISQVREAWESQRKSYTSDFFELDPCTEVESMPEPYFLADLFRV